MLFVTRRGRVWWWEKSRTSCWGTGLQSCLSALTSGLPIVTLLALPTCAPPNNEHLQHPSSSPDPRGFPTTPVLHNIGPSSGCIDSTSLVCVQCVSTSLSISCVHLCLSWGLLWAPCLKSFHHLPLGSTHFRTQVKYHLFQKGFLTALPYHPS